MKHDIKEPIEILKRAQEFEDSAIVMAIATINEKDAYKYRTYVDGKNRPCREALVCLLSDFVDAQDNIEGQLSMIKFFKVMLGMKKKEVEQKAKEGENK